MEQQQMIRRDRLAERFSALRAAKRTALIFYVTAGDPTLEISAPLLHALVEGGADVIELGYPFCDPILDGPVIRQANRRSLNGGGSFNATLSIVSQFRARDVDTPIVLMGYANPVISRGSSLYGDMAEAGADALIIPDMPMREAMAILPLLNEAGLSLIPLVPPQGLVDQQILASRGIGGFIYCIALAGPTGGAPAVQGAVEDAVVKCRALSDLPVAVGFGIKTPDLAADLAPYADAVIVGSALVDRIYDFAMRDSPTEEFLANIVEFCQSFRRAIDDVR